MTVDIIAINSAQLDDVARALMGDELRALMMGNEEGSRHFKSYMDKIRVIADPKTPTETLRKQWTELWGDTLQYGSPNAHTSPIDAAIIYALRGKLPNTRTTVVDVAFIRAFINKNTHINAKALHASLKSKKK